jgi:hypothetical protein
MRDRGARDSDFFEAGADFVDGLWSKRGRMVQGYGVSDDSGWSHSRVHANASHALSRGVNQQQGPRAIMRPLADRANVGLALDCRPGQKPRISDVEVGSPAQRAGLRVNDRIYSVDGLTTLNMSHERITQVLATQRSAQMVMEIARQKQPGAGTQLLTIAITRSEIQRDFFEVGADVVDSLWAKHKNPSQETTLRTRPPTQGTSGQPETTEKERTKRWHGAEQDQGLSFNGVPSAKRAGEARWDEQQHTVHKSQYTRPRKQDFFQVGAEVIDSLWTQGQNSARETAKGSRPGHKKGADPEPQTPEPGPQTPNPDIKTLKRLQMLQARPRTRGATHLRRATEGLWRGLRRTGAGHRQEADQCPRTLRLKQARMRLLAQERVQTSTSRGI